MHTKIILFFIILIISSFFYLHTVNTAVATFYIAEGWTFTLPITLLVFGGFIAGVTLTVFNSLFVDIKRVIVDIRGKREKKAALHAEENYRSAVTELYKGEPARAIKLLKKSLDTVPKDRDVLLRLVDASLEDGDRAGAIELLEGELSKRPEDLEVIFRLVECASGASDSQNVERHLNAVLRIDKLNPKAHEMLKNLKVAQGEWEEAAKVQRSIVKKRGKASNEEKVLLAAYLYESALSHLASERLERAEDELKEAINIDDSFVPAHLLMGDVMLKKGNANNAAKLWEKAFARHKDVAFILRIEELYLAESDPEKIIALYRRLCDGDPTNTRLHLLLARLYLKLEMVDNAIEVLLGTSGATDDGFYGQLLLASAYHRRSQPERAVELYERALITDKELMPSFVCIKCGVRERLWNGRCPGCGQWGSLKMSEGVYSTGGGGGAVSFKSVKSSSVRSPGGTLTDESVGTSDEDGTSAGEGTSRKSGNPPGHGPDQSSAQASARSSTEASTETPVPYRVD